MNSHQQNDNSAVTINGEVFLNYYGLKKTGLSDEFLTRYFNHLISLASRREIKAYIFVNGPLTVHFSYRQFRRLNLINEISFIKVAASTILFFIAEFITQKKLFDPWDHFSYFGFFHLSRPSLQAHTNFIFAKPDNKSGYIENNLLKGNVRLYLSNEDVVEPKPNIFLLVDQTALRKNLDERLLSEVFFKKNDISGALSPQVGSFDKMFERVLTTELTIEENWLFKNDPHENQLKDDFVLKSNAKLVAAYWNTLLVENTSKFRDNKDIVQALINKYGHREEFELDFISRRLKAGIGEKKLITKFQVEHKPYNSTSKVQKIAEEKESVLITALAELLCTENPSVYKSNKSLLKPGDTLYGDKESPKLGTLEKRLGKGRRILGISRK